MSLVACVLSLALSAPAAAQSPAPSSATTAEPVKTNEKASFDAVAAYESRTVQASQFGRAVIGEVAFSPSGRAIVLGFDPWQKTHARAFHSKDAQAWRSRGLPGGVRFASGVRSVSPQAIASLSDGLVAVGGARDPGTGPRSKHAVIWHSKDGARWSQLGTLRNFAPADLAAGPDGLLLAGQRTRKKGGPAPVVWRSKDGGKWQQQRLDETGPPPQAVAISAGGVELVLGVKYRADGSRWTRLWRAQGSGRWSRVDFPGGLGEDARIAVPGMVATPNGFLLSVIEEERLVDTLWRSIDGLEWERVPMPEDWSLERTWVLAQPWPWRSLIHPARSFEGMASQPALALTADGGATWCRAEAPQPSGVYLFDVAMSPDGRLLGVGNRRLKKAFVWLVEPSEDLGPTTGEQASPCEPAPLGEAED